MHSQYRLPPKLSLAASPITTDDPTVLAGKKVIAVEDGPTCTHGGMAYGAGLLGAEAAGAREIVDPRPYLVGELKDGGGPLYRVDRYLERHDVEGDA